MCRYLNDKVRFEVLNRDNFTCQYCGRSAPDVILHVDHIMPVSRGGSSELDNLTTACLDCNLGKSDSFKSRLTTQYDLMVECLGWIEDVCNHWVALTGIFLTLKGIRQITDLIIFFTPWVVFSAIDLLVEEGIDESKDTDSALLKLGRFCEEANKDAEVY